MSSSANLFDASARLPIAEDGTIVPGSPYGESKYILERMLHWLEHTKGLRYFNAAGASATRGEHHQPETHPIPVVLQVAQGKRDHIKV